MADFAGIHFEGPYSYPDDIDQIADSYPGFYVVVCKSILGTQVIDAGEYK